MPQRMRHGFGTTATMRRRLPVIVKKYDIVSRPRVRRTNPPADANQKAIARAQPSLEVTSYVERHAFAARGGMDLGWQ